jgi:gamma-glutamylcyclotransferase (GGCT)/AIG2-like uncharacterized protein YtfP
MNGSAWRLKSGMPVLLEQGQDPIQGHLLTLKGVDLLYSILDEFQGVNWISPEIGLHFRKQIQLRCSEGTVGAFCYFLNPEKLPRSAQKIIGGKWQEALQMDPPLSQTLTDRQRDYLRRLAGASGREIVPINDMSLYRELINLELIVDKGRRLALSQLGREVVPYLG